MDCFGRFAPSQRRKGGIIARGVASWQSILSFDFMESLESFKDSMCDSTFSLRLDSARLFAFMDCFGDKSPRNDDKRERCHCAILWFLWIATIDAFAESYNDEVNFAFV